MPKQYDLNINISANATLAEQVKALERMVELKKQLKGDLDLTRDEDVKQITEILAAQKKVIEQTNRLKKSVKDKTREDKEAQKLQKQLLAATDKEVKGKIRLRVATQQQTKALKEEVLAELGLIDATKKLETETAKAQRNFKNLAIQYGVNSKQAKAAEKAFLTLDSRLRAVNMRAKDGHPDVGRYGLAWQKAAGALRSVGAALGITAGLAGLARIVSSSIGVFSTFEKSNSKLEAVLGATNEQMALLAQQAKDLGAVTAFTASEVTGLQIEFAKLGFPTEDIQLMTESTLNAAAAMDSDLGETAKLVGATLKAFGLDASEATRVNDVLAKSTSASALDFQKLSTSMSTIAPVANAFGFSLEGSTALLGQLSNAGFDASTAATATRNILLNLADSNGKLAKSLKEPVTDLPSLVKGLKQLKGEGIDLGEAFELTDKRSVAAFSTFLEGTDSVLELNDALEQAAGTAQAMADTQLDNLAGSLTILNSAWEGFILSLEDGNGEFSQTLRTLVDVTTEVLSLLTGTEKLNSELDENGKKVRASANAFLLFLKTIGLLIKSFIIYKAVVFAVSGLMAAGTVITNIYTVAQKALSGGIKGATVSMKAFNAASKANIIGAVVALLLLAIDAFEGYSKGAKEAAARQRELNEANREARRLAQINILSAELALKNQIRIDAQIKRGVSLSKIKRDLTNQLAAAEKFQAETRIKDLDRLEKAELARLQAEFDARGGRSFKGSVIRNAQIKLEADLLAVREDFLKRREKLDNTVLTKEAARADLRVGALRINLANLDALLAQQDTRIKDKDDGKEKRDTRLRDLRTRNIKLNFSRELKLLQDKFDDEIAKEKTTDAIKIELVKKFQKDVLALEEKFDKDIAAVVQQRLNDEVTLQQAQLSELEILKAKGADNDAAIAQKEIDVERAKLDSILANENISFAKKKLAEVEFRKFQAKQEKKATDLAKEEDQKRLDQITNTLSTVTQRTIEESNRRAQDRAAKADQAIADQEANIEVQRQRAIAGQDNTLENEQRVLAQLELDREASAKKEARRQKILSYFALLQGYAKSDSKTALQNTIRDIAISEAITVAFAEKGGVAGSVSDSTTIDSGAMSRSHGKGRDVLTMMDKDEGILTRNRMSKIGGEKGFDKLGALIDSGMLFKDFMFPRVPQFTEKQTKDVDSRLIDEIKTLQDVVRKKPVPSLEMDENGNVIKREVTNGYRKALKVMRDRPRF